MEDYSSPEFWAKAPEGATHYTTADDAGSKWLREDDKGHRFYWFGRWVAYVNNDGHVRHFNLAVARPVHKPWNGEGLPPVGTDCACGVLGRLDPAPLNEWREGETITCVAHVRPQGGALLPLFWNARTSNASTLASHCYGPIRTPEQIAAEEREKAVRHMAAVMHEATGFGANIADCQALYDAGYRLVEGGAQ